MLSEKFNDLRGKRGRLPPGESPIYTFASRHGLTATEARILHERAVEGRTDKQIAYAINCASSTVRVHWNNIYNKTGLKNRSEIVAYAWKASCEDNKSRL